MKCHPLWLRLVAVGILGSGRAASAQTCAQAAWSTLSATGTAPSARSGHTAVYDPIYQRMVIFGGSTGTANSTMKDELWVLSLGSSPAWSGPYTVSSGGPSARRDHVAIYCPIDSSMVIFGGEEGGTGEDLGDVWKLDLRSSSLSSPSWQEISADGGGSGTHICPREGAAAVYDPTGPSGHPRMVVCQGSVDIATDDAWGFDLVSHTWARVSTCSGELYADCIPPNGNICSTLPNPRWYHVAIYDPEHDRLIAHGGDYRQIAELTYGDTWSADLSQTSVPWTLIGANWTSAVPQLSNHRGFYDSRTKRMFVTFGSEGSESPGTMYSDSYVFDPAHDSNGWSLVPVSGSPAVRCFHSIVYDAANDRAVVFGGRTLVSDVPTFTNDLLQLQVSKPGSVSLTVTTGRTSARIEWTAPDGYGSCDAASAYDLRYSSSPITSDTDFNSATPVSGVPAPDTPGTPQCAFIDGLTHCHTYYWAMKTTNGLGDYTRGSSTTAATKCNFTEVLDCLSSGYGLAISNPAPEAAAARDFVSAKVDDAARLLEVRFGVRRASDYELSLYDVAGRRLASLGSGHLDAGEQKLAVPLAAITGLRAGATYFVRLRGDSGTLATSAVRR